MPCLSAGVRAGGPWLLSHLASQHGIYPAHLLTGKEEVGEVCTPVPT